MKILQYRTIAEVYPHLSLEAKIELDDGKIVYSNISVNGQKEKEVYDANRDDKWTYTAPLDKIDWMVPEDYYYGLSLEEDFYIFNHLIDFWNSNPIFINDGVWRPFPLKIERKVDEKRNTPATLSELFVAVSDEEMLEIYKDIIGSKELGITVNSLKPYAKQAKEINSFETTAIAMKVAEDQFYKEITKRFMQMVVSLKKIK